MKIWLFPCFFAAAMSMSISSNRFLMKRAGHLRNHVIQMVVSDSSDSYMNEARKRAEEAAEKSIEKERNEARQLAKLLRAEAAAAFSIEKERKEAISYAAKISEQRQQAMKTTSAVSTFKSSNTVSDDSNKEFLAGLVVALATIPTSIAYSSIIGLNPLAGIWSSVIVGMTVALYGGSPGLIAGAAGVIAVPLSKLFAAHGSNYMAATVILASFLEIVFGKLKLGKLVDQATPPVIAGFLNSFAYFLFKSQVT
jgi:hypothetical protein